MRLVDRAIQDVREMSQLLRPTILDDFGLDAALRSLTESFCQRTGIQVKYDSNVDGRRLNDDTETNLFRIAQEALTNVARHANATQVNVNLSESGGNVLLRIADNGGGFDAEKQSSSRGLGLTGMQTRARGCGGSLRVENEPGKGLRVEVTCPSDRVSVDRRKMIRQFLQKHFMLRHMGALAGHIDEEIALRQRGDSAALDRRDETGVTVQDLENASRQLIQAQSRMERSCE